MSSLTLAIVVIGAGQIGQAIARRVGVRKHVVLEEFGAGAIFGPIIRD